MSATKLTDTNNISIYVHWPYCVNKCPYCDFNSFVSNKAVDFKAWQQAYLKQIDMQAKYIGNKTVKSIFFGGGTPSLMSPDIVNAIISSIGKLNNNTMPTEITLECNPSSVEVSKLQQFKQAGVNRVSIGVQSFKEANLQFLGRNHNPKEAIMAIESANKIFDRVSFDLINGLPNQNLQHWKQELDYANSLITSHISVYELTIEPNTAFFKQKIKPARSKEAIELFEYTINFLTKNNIKPYEISNYAKEGAESIHNLQYWTGGLYIGIGPGAHGRIIEEGNLYATESYKNPAKWLTETNKNNMFSEYYPLSKKQRLLEMLVLNLRLYRPISTALADNIDTNVFNALADNGYIKQEGNKLYVTHLGRLQLNSLISYIGKNI